MPDKSIEEKYIQFTQLEHILKRPDTYVGDIKLQTANLWTYNPDENIMHKKKVEFTPALLKIFDEIIVNAGDNTKTDKTCDCIKVNINKEDNEITVWNNGKGIDVVMHS